jgi:hypothetical protein
MGWYPVAVVILHVYRMWHRLLLNLSREGYMRSREGYMRSRAETNCTEGCVCSTSGFTQFAAFLSSFKNYIFIHPLPQSTMCISTTKKINPSKPYKPNAVSNVNIICTFFLIFLQILVIIFVILNNCSTRGDPNISGIWIFRTNEI